LAGNDVVIEAFTELAPQYEEVVDQELRRFWGISYREFVDRLIEAIPVRDDDLVLDVATGTARIPLALATRTRVESRTIGLDITPAMLEHGQRDVDAKGLTSCIKLVCASAMAMPFVEGVFDKVICGLGTHHMDIPQMLSEMSRVLKAGGELVLADVAASPSWKLPGVKTIIRLIVLSYFLSGRNFARAWAEAIALSNIHTAAEWCASLSEFGFVNIEITESPARHRWYPCALTMKAVAGKI
jgi:ubiquinone/menaquinone biosynthesis C-methylase UbiE